MNRPETIETLRSDTTTHITGGHHFALLQCPSDIARHRSKPLRCFSLL